MSKRVIRTTGLLAILCFGAFAGKIDRIDIFDSAENPLLFVTLEYDSAGNNIGRTVYTSDSTFLRSTSFTKDQSGNITAENSIDYEENPLFTTSISQQTGKTNFTINDQFKMDFLGAPMSYARSSAGEYTISQSGSTLYMQKYEYDSDGTLNRINYTDPSGKLLYYATVKQQTGIINSSIHGKNPQLVPVFHAGLDGKLLVTFSLAKPSIVTIEIFNSTGRLASKTLKKSVAAGRQTLTMKCNDQLSAGTYISRISVNGSQVFHGRLILVR